MQKKWLVTTAMLAAIAGVSGAIVSQTFPSANAAAAGNAAVTAPAATPAASESPDGEVPDAQEQTKAVDTQEKPGTEVPDAQEKQGTEAQDAQEKPGTEVQDSQEKPGTEVPDAQENAALAGKAKITSDDAVKAALAQVKGTVKDTHLEDENGAVVYNVAVIDDQKSVTEVKVDAVSGKVLKAEKDAGDENGKDGEKQDGQDQQDGKGQQDNGADGENAND